MTDPEKLCSDINRIKKHERAQNGGRYNALRVCEKAASLFENERRNFSALPASMAEFWMSTYIRASVQPDEEPSDENIDKLAAMLSFLDGDSSGCDCLTETDWTQLGQLVNYEAEELPIETLSNLMTIIVDKKVIK
jgi:hypothetical protein